MSEETIDTLTEQLKQTDDFDLQLEIRDRILEIKRKEGKIKPPEQDIECFGCGS